MPFQDYICKRGFADGYSYYKHTTANMRNNSHFRVHLDKYIVSKIVIYIG
jgi:hypothetical protein